MLQGKTVLFVHATSPRKIFILKRLQELGATIICLNRTVADFAEAYVDGWILEDLNNEVACIEKVAEYIAAHPERAIDGVVTFWDECTLLTARLAERFGWVGIPYETARNIKNKALFRAVCQERNLPGPRHVLLTNESDVKIADATLSYPLIVKPVYGAASAFVTRVEDKNELAKVIAAIKKSIDKFWLAPEWHSFEILAEEYVIGDEVDLDILIQNGEIQYFAITDNQKTNEPYFVETGWSAPSSLSAERQKKLRIMAEKTLLGLGVKDGCIHFEAKSKPDGEAVPIEINLRMGGGEVYLYSKTVWNVDLVENAVLISLGITIDITMPKQPLIHLGSYRFLPTSSCVIRSIDVKQELYDRPYFVDLYFEKKTGDLFLAPPEGYDRCIGVLTVSGESAERVEQSLHEAIQLVTCETESR
jgi:biotin carboxylase